MDKILLDGKVPIRLIQEPYCEKCFNQVSEDEVLCHNCLSPPSVVEDWYFNKITALGVYRQFEKIPINTLSELILILKFRKQEKFKNFAGNLLADGLIQLIRRDPDLFVNSKYLITSPKFDKTELNQCKYIIEPLLKMMNKRGFDIEDITDNTERIRDVGKNKKKGLEQRFRDIQGVHKVNIDNLNGEKVIILDDILSTCSTAWDLSRALKEKNAGEINILVPGRHWLFNEWPISKILHYENIDFNELITYFSKLDIHRDKRKITKVKIMELNIEENMEISAEIEGTDENYHLLIDMEKKVITHNCHDFIHDRIKNKKFCKHITKVFLEIRESKGENFARNILNAIYSKLNSWTFKEIQ